jgi:hypothetical protein
MKTIYALLKKIFFKRSEEEQKKLKREYYQKLSYKTFREREVQWQGKPAMQYSENEIKAILPPGVLAAIKRIYFPRQK